MYEEYYGLSGNPFRLTPDSRFWFGSESHRKAMSYLKYGLYQGEGFIVITGDVGTGKSTLVGQLFNEMDENDIVAAQIGTTQIDASEAIKLICSSFGVVSEANDKASLLAAFQEFLIVQNRSGRRVLLVVDEAQNLPVRTLEELRMLSNLNDNGQPLFQNFLIGQPQFLKTLSHPDLAQLQQRVIASYSLQSMTKEETQEYIEHRLSAVDWNGTPQFTEDAFARIFQETKGVPRRINTLSNRIMLYASLESFEVIDSKVVYAVIQDLQKETVTSKQQTAQPTQAASQDSRAQRQAAQAVRTTPQRTTTAQPSAASTALRNDSANYQALEQRIKAIETTISEHDKALRELVEFAMTMLDNPEQASLDTELETPPHAEAG